MNTTTETVRDFYERWPFPNLAEAAGGFIELGAGLARHWLAGWGAEGPPPGAAWIDLGCGSGEITAGVARELPGVRVIGIDFSRASLQVAGELAATMELANLEFIHGDITRLDELLGPLAACVISAMGSIHHTPDPPASFRASLRHLAARRPMFFLGLYSALNRGPLLRVNHALFAIHPDPAAHPERLQTFRELFLEHLDDPDLNGMAERFGGRHRIPDQWLLDTFCHPLEHAYDAADILEWARGTPLRLTGWLGLEQIERQVAAAACRERVAALGEEERLRLLDLLTPHRFRTFILEGVNG